MKIAFAAAAAVSVVVIAVNVAESSRVAAGLTQPSPFADQRIAAAMLGTARSATPPAVSNEALNAVVQRYNDGAPFQVQRWNFPINPAQSDLDLLMGIFETLWRLPARIRARRSLLREGIERAADERPSRPE